MALNAIVRAADRAGWQQAVLLGTPRDEPAPVVHGLDSSRVRPLVFDSDALPFALPGMSDVMPYRSLRFSEMTSGQLSAYSDAWRDHVADAIEEFQPDVIHSHHVWLVSSLVKDVTQSVPVVTHCHGTGLRQLELCPELALSVHSGCSRNDAFLLLHAGHANALRTELGVAADRMSIVGSGFRDDVFHDRGRPPRCGPVVTYAGKLSNAKGVPWLLEAVEQLSRQIPDLVLNVAGAGSGIEADAIRERMNEMENIEFHGQLTPEQLADLLRRSSMFVLPSFYEGLPLVLIEAAACGCRIVATALPGVVDQLQPVLGNSLELVPLPRLESADRPVDADLPDFVDGLARAIAVALTKGLHGTDSHGVARMTWDSVFEKIEAVWRRLIADRSPRERGVR